MRKFGNRPISYMAAFVAAGLMSLTTGCASGGFHLTRQYAGFVNRQEIIIRIILYIFTSIVFFATLLIDLVIFNTVDFWQGRVSAGDYQFKNGKKLYQVRHEYLPNTHFRRSTIHISEDGKALQVVVLNETPNGEIEVKVDGQVRGRVHSITEIPVVSLYDQKGQWSEDRLIVTPMVASGQTTQLPTVGASSVAVF